MAEAVWQYSNHVAYNLWEHDGPILIASNFDGAWPGLVGALGLEACLSKRKFSDKQAGHSILWSSEEFKDKLALVKLESWLGKGKIEHDTSHVHEFKEKNFKKQSGAIAFGEKAAGQFP